MSRLSLTLKVEERQQNYIINIILLLVYLIATWTPAKGVVTVNLPATVSYEYDANGNLTSDGLRTFDYDDDNQLIRVAAGDWETHFVYDAFLRRRAALHYKAATNGTTDFVKGAASLSSLIRSNSHAWVGAKFTVGPVPLVVTELGRWMLAGNSQTHTLRIARADGVDIASTTVNMSGGTVGQFKYAALASPATLSAYTTYYLVSEEFINGDGWYSFDNVLNTTSAATIDNMAYANTNNPNLFINGSHGEKEWKVGDITAEQRKLPLRGIWNDTLLVERIEAGWSPSNDRT
jgi:YD repeat-containing protein